MITKFGASIAALRVTSAMATTATSGVLTALLRARRANLGLERHVAALIPVYAMALAAGVVVPAPSVARVAPDRVVRWTVSDVSDFNLLVESARRGEVWVTSTPARVTQLREGIGVIWRDERSALLRRRAPAVIDRALLQEADAHRACL